MPSVFGLFTTRLGYLGRLLSASKSRYSSNHPHSVVFFNANVFDERGAKVWFGDVDTTLEMQTLQSIADEIDEAFYVTREQPWRWETDEVELVKKLEMAVTAGVVDVGHASVIKIVPSKQQQ